MMAMHYGVVDTPVGPLQATWEIALDGDTVLTALTWGKQEHPHTNPAALLNTLKIALQGYFETGDDEALQSLPVYWDGTAFQQRVWQAAQAIPYGHTVTYGQLAEFIGCDGGAQAIGQALKKNPLPLVIPCHRVVAAGYKPNTSQQVEGIVENVAMGGYMGEMNSPVKQQLLAHETAKTPAAKHIEHLPVGV